MRGTTWICILLVFLANGAIVEGAEDRPNIVLILVDDQSKASIGGYGGKTWTPNIDRLAREGMKFNHAHVSSPLCTPSRYSFLTGRYAGRSQSWLYETACGGPETQGFPSQNMALEADLMNVGNILRAAGYVTGFVGKFGLMSDFDFPQFYEGPEDIREVPADAERGPDTSELFRHNERLMRRYIKDLGFSWAKHIYPENLQLPYEHHNAEWTVEAALDFIEQNKEGPFYLHYCTTLLHGGQGSWRRSMDEPLVSGEGELETLPAVMTPRAELLRKLAQGGFDPDAPVAGEAWLDDSIGAILKKLDEAGIADNTLVVYAADHGREGKASLFSEDGTCVPFIARWPKHIPSGSVCNELIQNIDWAPTVFELADAHAPGEYHIDGRSLVPLLATGKADEWRDHLYFEMGFARAVTTKEWKYIAVRYPEDQILAIQRARPDRLPRLMAYIGRLGIGVRGASHPGFFDEDQLYELSRDPSEMNNVAEDPNHAATLAEMRARLATSVAAIRRPFGEFVSGGNSSTPGRIDEAIEAVKKLRIEHKTVTIPADDE